MSDREGPLAPEFTASGALLVKTFGPWLLGYLCATEEGVLRQWLASEESTLDERREEVLTELRGLATRLASEATDHLARRAELAGVLGRYLPEQRTTIGNAIRLHAGGSIDLASPEDDVEGALVSLMHDAYPLLLIPPDPEDPIWRLPFFGLFGHLHQYPGWKRFEEAVLADRVLAKLFPKKTESTGWMGSVYRSTGAGGSLQLATFPELLITHAWWWQRLSSGPPTPEQLARELGESLVILRKAIRGESTEIRALVALAGIVLADGTSRDTPVGTLRCMSEREREIVPSPLEGHVSHTSADGITTTGAYAGDVVWETQLPYRIRTVPVHDSFLPAWPDPLDHALLERKVDTLRLAILLTTSIEATTTTTVTWRAKKDPLSWTPIFSWPAVREGLSMVPRTLSPTELEDLVAWIHRVDASRHSSVDVAVRRTISATSQRVDPADALIDLVIAWENLFGSRQGESTLRIAASLGWLLGSGADDREAVRSIVTSLYNLRSDIVHGNRVVTPQEAGTAMRIARDLTISALRTLYEHRTDLLRMRGGADRSWNLIMDSLTMQSREARPPSGGDAD